MAWNTGPGRATFIYIRKKLIRGQLTCSCLKRSEAPSYRRSRTSTYFCWLQYLQENHRQEVSTAFYAAHKKKCSSTSARPGMPSTNTHKHAVVVGAWLTSGWRVQCPSHGPGKPPHGPSTARSHAVPLLSHTCSLRPLTYKKQDMAVIFPYTPEV